MSSKRINLQNFKKGRILRLEELKLALKSKDPVWVYIKEYTSPKPKVDHADIGLVLEDGVRFIAATFVFNSLKEKDKCSINLSKTASAKKSIMKIYKAIPTRVTK